jgi:hypothetical protein
LGIKIFLLIPSLDSFSSGIRTTAFISSLPSTFILGSKMCLFGLMTNVTSSASFNPFLSNSSAKVRKVKFFFAVTKKKAKKDKSL